MSLNKFHNQIWEWSSSFERIAGDFNGAARGGTTLILNCNMLIVYLMDF